MAPDEHHWCCSLCGTCNFRLGPCRICRHVPPPNLIGEPT